MDAIGIKNKARELGADLVGIVSGKRLTRAVMEIDLKAQSADDLEPGAGAVRMNTTGEFESGARKTGSKHGVLHFPFSEKGSAIIVGHRVLRGALRGIEEGTNYNSTYGMFGKGWPERQFLSRTVYELVCFLERQGVEAAPVPGTGFDISILACAAGLGTIGKGGFFLSPQYGHRQRLAVVFTSAEFETDAPYSGDLCGDCHACIEACPLEALSESGVNFKRCLKCRNGALACPEQYPPVDRLAAACGRACLGAMEKRISNRFEHPFRKRSAWFADADGVIHLEEKK